MKQWFGHPWLLANLKRIRFGYSYCPSHMFHCMYLRTTKHCIAEPMERSDEMEGLLTWPFMLEKVIYVTWYNQARSITLIQRNYRTEYTESSPVRISILWWAWSSFLRCVGNFDDNNSREFSSTEKTWSVFQQRKIHLEVFYTISKQMSTKCRDKSNKPWNSIHNILLHILHKSPYKLHVISKSEDCDHTVFKSCTQ